MLGIDLHEISTNMTLLTELGIDPVGSRGYKHDAPTELGIDPVGSRGYKHDAPNGARN